MIPYLAYRARMSVSLKDLLPPNMAFLLYRLSCGCLSRKHCWKRKSKQNPYAATQFVNFSLYAQLLTSSGHIGQTLSLSLKPAQPRPPVYRRGRATIPCPLVRFEKVPDYHHPSFIQRGDVMLTFCPRFLEVLPIKRTAPISSWTVEESNLYFLYFAFKGFVLGRAIIVLSQIVSSGSYSTFSHGAIGVPSPVLVRRKISKSFLQSVLG